MAVGKACLVIPRLHRSSHANLLKKLPALYIAVEGLRYSVCNIWRGGVGGGGIFGSKIRLVIIFYICKH